MPGQAPFATAPANPSNAIEKQYFSTDFQNLNQGINLPKAWSMTGILRPIDLNVAGDAFYSYIDTADVNQRNFLLEEMARRFAGLQTKPSADIAITDPAVAPAALVAGATFQGVALTPGMTVLLAPPNGAVNATIYEVQATGAPVVPDYADNPDLAPSSSVRIQQGDFAERLYIFVNDAVPAPGEVLRWELQPTPVITNAGAGIGYDGNTNSYFIRNEDGSITIDPDGVHISAAYTQGIADRLASAIVPLVSRLDTLEPIVANHTQQITALTSAIAIERDRINALTVRMTAAETYINRARLLDWSVTLTNPTVANNTSTFVIDLGTAPWAEMGLTYDILPHTAYVVTADGGRETIRPSGGLVFAAGAGTATIRFSPAVPQVDVLLHRMFDARPAGSAPATTPAPAATTPSPQPVS